MKSDWAALDVQRGRRALEKRLLKGERIDVVIRATISPDPRTWSDDGTSTEFTLKDIVWAEAENAE